MNYYFIIDTHWHLLNCIWWYLNLYDYNFCVHTTFAVMELVFVSVSEVNIYIEHSKQVKHIILWEHSTNLWKTHSLHITATSTMLSGSHGNLLFYRGCADTVCGKFCGYSCASRCKATVSLCYLQCLSHWIFPVSSGIHYNVVYYSECRMWYELSLLFQLLTYVIFDFDISHITISNPLIPSKVLSYMYLKLIFGVQYEELICRP